MPIKVPPVSHWINFLAPTRRFNHAQKKLANNATLVSTAKPVMLNRRPRINN